MTMEKSNSRLQVKNKAPAAIQITAEQLIREAKERELEVVPPPPKQKISDSIELHDYQLRKRKEFEDNIRKNRTNISNWLKYAKWEEDQGEIVRARSIFRRALDAYGSRSIPIWMRYLQMEMKWKQVDHARKVFNEAVEILPRVNQFWYKFVYFERILGNIPYCRSVFERWMSFLPGEQEWQTYINFELDFREVDRAREIYSRFVMLYPEPKNWINFARFEERNSSPENARQVFEMAFEFFPDKYLDESLYIAFARFEERHHEYDRVKMIYEYALNKLPKERAIELYENYSNFQKKHGAQKDVENLISLKRKLLYEETLGKDPHDYDTWFDYIRLAEDEFTYDEVRDLYERAVANVPKNRTNKDCWRRYIYLWIYYACFEELVAKDMEKAFKVYEFCINDLIPHKIFTFSKLWLLAAQLKIRMGDIDGPLGARRILDKSLKRCPKRKLFKAYINLEMALRDFDRCRKLFEQFLQRAPDDSSIWNEYAELEAALGEIARARAIYNSAINRPQLDSPEKVWEAYIDFEVQLGKAELEEAEQRLIDQDKEEEVKHLYENVDQYYQKVVQLYEQWLNKTNHVNVWRRYAQFYKDLNQTTMARKVFERANSRLRDDEPLVRVLLLESWQEFERDLGDEGLDISGKMPTRTKKRKNLDDGSDYIEYYEYVFPDSDKKKSGLMDRVKRWKAQTNE